MIINGVEVADDQGTISVYDNIVLRGDGCFEATRIYDGVPFRLGDHLRRLQRSAAALRVELPAVDLIDTWCRKVAAEHHSAVLRVLASSGRDGEGTVIVLTHELAPVLSGYRLLPVEAPWHAAGRDWALAGMKTLSYAPNMSATREAVAAGFDDALLYDAERVVLELPTSTIMWAIDGRIETPSLDLHILDSITRRVVLELCDELGIEVAQDAFSLDRLESADEVLVLSSTKEIRPVVAVGDQEYDASPVCDRLGDAYSRRVLAER